MLYNKARGNYTQTIVVKHSEIVIKRSGIIKKAYIHYKTTLKNYNKAAMHYNTTLRNYDKASIQYNKTLRNDNKASIHFITQQKEIIALTS